MLWRAFRVVKPMFVLLILYIFSVATKRFFICHCPFCHLMFVNTQFILFFAKEITDISLFSWFLRALKNLRKVAPHINQLRESSPNIHIKTAIEQFLQTKRDNSEKSFTFHSNSFNFPTQLWQFLLPQRKTRLWHRRLPFTEMEKLRKKKHWTYHFIKRNPFFYKSVFCLCVSCCTRCARLAFYATLSQDWIRIRCIWTFSARKKKMKEKSYIKL